MQGATVMKSDSVLYLSRWVIVLSFFILIEPFQAAFGAANIRPERLRCEYRENPLGIDSTAPRLSWIVSTNGSSSRGLRQTAYQILVASTQDKLAADQGDLWDSGRVKSDETIQINYAGRKLSQGQACFWKVRVWDRQGQVSPWSETANWTMGLLGAPELKAKWIGPAPQPMILQDNPNRMEMSSAMWAARKVSEAAKLAKPDDPLPLLRREFNATKPIRRAIISVCGLGQYELRCNGTKVGDKVLDPGWTDYHKTCLYSTFDVTAMIRNGKNCLGVMLGNGMYHERGVRYWKFIGSFGSPKMILHMRIDYDDGTKLDILSDDAWHVASGPITLSSIFGGEDYDAQLEQPGWDSPGFDCSKWKTATVVDGPGGRLVAQSAPAIKVIKTFAPISVSEPKPRVFVYDLGQNFSGRPKVSLRGPARAKVRITPAEVLDENGLASQKGSGAPSYFTYTLKGKDTETWHPQFTYYGFRYLQVEGAVPKNKADGNAPVMLKIEGQFTRSAADRAGSFSCSNDLMNRIYRLVDWAIGSNMQSIITDCPHREKLGWIEIANIMSQPIMYNYDAASLYGKIVRDISDAQQPDGMIPTITPEYVVFSGAFRDTPGAFALNIPWQLYQWYGDRWVLAEHYAMMKRYVDYLSSRADGHIVAYGLGDWGDFPSVEEHLGWAQLTPISLTSTTIYYQNVKTLAHIATVLKKNDDARYYTSLAEEIRKAFNKALFNAKSNQYVVGMQVVPTEVRNQFNCGLFDPKTNCYAFGSQASQAAPLVMGIVDPERDEAVMASLVAEVGKHEYVTTGDWGFGYLLRALADRGRSDLIYQLHNRTDVPGYGWQIERGCTSLAEARDGRDCASLNHCTTGAIQQWFHADVLGICSGRDTLAFKQIIIRPQILRDLRWARGSYDSIRGKISVDWSREGDQLTLIVTIPANTSATVHVPTTDVAKVLENGRPATGATGVTLTCAAGGVAKYQVESGSYIFTAPLK